MSELIHWWVSNSDSKDAYTDIELDAGTYRFDAPKHGAFYVKATDALIRRGAGMFTVTAGGTAVRMRYNGRGIYRLFKE